MHAENTENTSFKNSSGEHFPNWLLDSSPQWQVGPREVHWADTTSFKRRCIIGHYSFSFLRFPSISLQPNGTHRIVNLRNHSLGMEEQFILRVPPSIAERIERLLNENTSSSEDKSLDLSFSAEDGRSGTFVIGNDHFPASLLDLPCVMESYKTYDDSVLIKTADIGQMIMVREEGDTAPDVVEYRHGLTPPMRDARKRRFRREPDLNPELVRRVEKDLLNIMAGGTAENVDVEVAEQEEDGDEHARNASKKSAPAPMPKPDVPEAGANAGEPDRSESDESDDSM